MNKKSEELIDNYGSKLTYLWNADHEMTEEELSLLDHAINIMLHVLHPKNELCKERIIELGLKPLGGK